MSRWLLNYTPQATLVRLLTSNSINAYLTDWLLGISGAFEDSRILLPAWISIASTLTFLFHLTQPRLTIMKGTSLSLIVFSIASFISMISLLLQLHLIRSSTSTPMFFFARHVWACVRNAVRLIEMLNVHN